MHSNSKLEQTQASSLVKISNVPVDKNKEILQMHGLHKKSLITSGNKSFSKNMG
jgi:uncharacterized protein YjbK